jgi:hypothetical protein
MLITSQNFTVDAPETSLRFVFRYRGDDFSTGMLVTGSVLFFIVCVIFSLFAFAFLREELQTVKHLSMSLFFSFLLLLLFLFGGKYYLTEIFWRLNGKEIVEINREGISICHQGLRFETRKNFGAEKIPCIFISPRKEHWFISASARENRFHNFQRGKIAFTSGKTFFGKGITFRFGSILDQDEISQVITLIHQKFPQYICPANGAA